MKILIFFLQCALDTWVLNWLVFKINFFWTVKGKQIINNFLRRFFTKLKEFFWFLKFLVNLLLTPKIGILFVRLGVYSVEWEKSFVCIKKLSD